MGPSASADNRSATRSPLGKPKIRGERGGNRGRKKRPALERIKEHSADRSELWHKGDSAKAREKDARIPRMSQIRRLTEDLGQDFGDERENKAGTLSDKLALSVPEAMREENSRLPSIKRREWKGL